jgi:prolyl oligopeptidase
VNAGHGAGMPLNKAIDLSADTYAFTLWNMGIKELTV